MLMCQCFRIFKLGYKYCLNLNHADRQQRVLAEQQRDLAEQRAEALAQMLRELGIEPKRFVKSLLGLLAGKKLIQQGLWMSLILWK
jgi:hypothetical protein